MVQPCPGDGEDRLAAWQATGNNITTAQSISSAVIRNLDDFLGIGTHLSRLPPPAAWQGEAL